jgi:hypothetical protein
MFLFWLCLITALLANTGSVASSSLHTRSVASVSREDSVSCFEYFCRIIWRREDSDHSSSRLIESSQDSSRPIPTTDDFECYICFEEIIPSDKAFCCRRGHSIHKPCFAAILTESIKERHICSFCRDPLITSASEYLDLVRSSDLYDPDPKKINFIVGHKEPLIAAGILDTNSVEWENLFKSFLTDRSARDLKRFLEFEFDSINRTFPSDGECPLSFLLNSKIRKDSSFNVILSFPSLELDHVNPFTDEHLVYSTIRADEFSLFLRVMEASPKLDRFEVFKFVCTHNTPDSFFHYFLQLEDFHVFQADPVTSKSALHICAEKAQVQRFSALLDHHNFRSEFLISTDSQDRSVIQIATNFFTDEILVERLLSYSSY